MSEHEMAFIAQLRSEFDAFRDDLDKRYSRMQTFLLTMLTVLLSAGLVVGFTHFTRDGETRTTVADNANDIEYIMDNSVSQKAIDRLIITFENQNEVMLRFFPNDLQEGIKQMNKMNADTRSQIMMFNSSLRTRSGGESDTENGGTE
jgi:hypothetical protein